MAERFAERVMAGIKGQADDVRNGAAGERQLSALAFSLQVRFKDGRRTRGLAMSHYVDFQWDDEGEAEKLIIIFDMRLVIVEGELLSPVVEMLDQGRLTLLQEMTHREVQELRRDNPGRLPIITRVTVEPDMQSILSQMRGANEDETRNTRRVN